MTFKPWHLFVAIAAIWASAWTFAIVHGQDADPRYYCLSDNPTLKNKCEQDEANKIRDLQMRVEIWNLLNCSVRDICTPVTDNNGTGVPIAPQIENDTGYNCHDHFGNGTVICHPKTK